LKAKTMSSRTAILSIFVLRFEQAEKMDYDPALLVC